MFLRVCLVRDHLPFRSCLLLCRLFESNQISQHAFPTFTSYGFAVGDFVGSKTNKNILGYDNCIHRGTNNWKIE